MNYDDQIKEITTYKFERVTTYSNGEQFTDVKVFTEDALEGCYTVVWEDVANMFLLWLGGVYGYEVRGQVKLPSDMPTMEEIQAWCENHFPRTMSSAKTAQNGPGCAYCKD